MDSTIKEAYAYFSAEMERRLGEDGLDEELKIQAEVFHETQQKFPTITEEDFINYQEQLNFGSQVTHMNEGVSLI
jgi:hypothetical protein